MTDRPLIYLTYGDVDSPVYRSQVVGFCDFLEKELQIPVLLVAFVPLRLYQQQKQIMSEYERAIKVLPVVNRWQGKEWYSRFNARVVDKLGGATVMTRNPVAVHLCSALQRRGWKFIYDARGCHYAELEEYSDAPATQVKAMRDAEFACFKHADWVFSVSKALVEHFKEQARYRDHNHSIVPCCYLPNTSRIEGLSEELFGEGQYTVFVYAGALTVWNFPKSFLELCRAILRSPDHRLIILSAQKEVLDEYDFLQNDERVVIRSVKANEVPSYLEISDYAILLRKKALTNQVASPSKFGEYLSAGCRVIISPGIGDLSDLVIEEGIGIQYRGKKDDTKVVGLDPLTVEERQRIQALARRRFLRSSAENLIKYRNLQQVHQDRVNA